MQNGNKPVKSNKPFKLVKYVGIGAILIGLYAAGYKAMHVPPTYRDTITKDFTLKNYNTFSPVGRWTSYDRELQNLVISKGTSQVTSRRERERAKVYILYAKCMDSELTRLMKGEGDYYKAKQDMSKSADECAAQSYQKWYSQN